MIGPGWASNPDSPITIARQRVLRCYQQHHRGRLINQIKSIIKFTHLTCFLLKHLVKMREKKLTPMSIVFSFMYFIKARSVNSVRSGQSCLILNTSLEANTAT